MSSSKLVASLPVCAPRSVGRGFDILDPASWSGAAWTPLLQPCTVAAIAVVVATLVRLQLDPLLDTLFPFATYYVAVAASAWYGGPRPGMAATVVGGLLGVYLFVPPRPQMAVSGLEYLTGTVLFFIVSASMVLFVHRSRGWLLQTREATRHAEERQRQLTEEMERRRRAEEKLVHARAALRDTVLRQASDSDARLAELERLKSFVATLSHELRTPLNAIIGFSTLMHDEVSGAVNDEQREQLAIVLDAARHLLALIDQILLLSRIEAGEVPLQMDSVDLRAVATRVVEILRPEIEKRKLQVIVEGMDGLPAVRTDKQKVLQILLNLASNAIKFTSHGEVRLLCEPCEQGVVVHVVDTGTGMRQEDLVRLFQPFYRIDAGKTPFEGTGLGLHTSRRLARVLGGDITVRSSPGAGSTFSLYLPTT